VTAPPGLVAVVLAAGAGTRLQPLTHHRPKAMCPVGNRPLVDWALDRVRPHVAEVAVNVHHGRHLLEAHLCGRVHLSVEQPQVLGTAGALGNLRGWIDGRDVLVVNADVWHRTGLDGLLGGWDRQRVRLLAVHDPPRGDFGDLRYCGAALMPWSAVRRLRPVPSGLYETSWAPLAAERGLELVRSDVPFIDCGTPADYLAANLDWSGGGSVVAGDAVVEGHVVRSVVWPGGIVHTGERLVDAIRIGADVTVQTGRA
jgi:N-acetyl-alpha-D-muramate 1-phosphate uridylyltransferase